MKKIFIILFCLISLVSKAQVYQSMPQYGYGPVKRFDIDSSLTIPTTCGVPTLRTTLTKKAAIAFDSCNNRFYQYNPKTFTWSVISGGGGGSQNLQEVTDQGSTTTNQITAQSFATDGVVGYAIYNGTNILYNNGAGSIVYPTTDQTITFPEKSGTLALTSDITTIDTTSLSNRIEERVPYTGAIQDVDLGTFSLNAKSVKINGTNGNGHLDLKHQNSDATATGSSTALFANSNGDLKWKNDNKHYTTLATNQSANRVYTFQDKTYTLADSVDVSNKLNASDTSSLSNRINTKLNSSDSSTYYTKYRSDTSRTNIYNALNTKLNKSDTSTLSSRIDAKGYAITIGHTQSNYAASTTYYYGMTAAAFTTTAAIRRIYIPVSGTIKAAYLYARTTGATSTQTWTMSIRLNNNSNTSIGSVSDGSLDKVWSNTGLSISVVAGDYIEITTTTPAWSVAAGNTTIYGTIFIQ